VRALQPWHRRTSEPFHRLTGIRPAPTECWRLVIPDKWPTCISENELQWWVQMIFLLILIHHRHRVACPVMDVAVPTSLFQAWRFCARRWAVSRPMLSGAKSDSTVRSQVWCGRPDRRFQSFGKWATHALRARLWSVDGLARAVWPKGLRRVVRVMCVNGGWTVRRRTSLFVICHSSSQTVDSFWNHLETYLFPSVVDNLWRLTQQVWFIYS